MGGKKKTTAKEVDAANDSSPRAATEAQASTSGRPAVPKLKSSKTADAPPLPSPGTKLRQEEQRVRIIHQSNVHRDREFLLELVAKLEQPLSLPKRLQRLARIWAFRVDFILGRYFFDPWETVLMYSLYILFAFLVLYGGYKQMYHGAELIYSLTKH